MKLSKKIITLGLSSLVLLGLGVSAFSVNATKQQNSYLEAEAATEYVRYYNDDLGFATRDSGDNRVAKGDTDGNFQSVGNVLSPKSELMLELKQQDGDSWWVGVGGYAIYVTSGSLRFLYLTRNESACYGRNAPLSGLVLKTSDGSSSFPINYFTDYVRLTMRFDFTNMSAVKLSVVVEYSGVNYYIYNGDSKIETYTYSNTPINFDSSYNYRAMIGRNMAGNPGGSIAKLQTQTSKEKDLSNVISGANGHFDYGKIGDLDVEFPLSEQISSYTGYLGDHLSSWKDKNGATIDISNSILINGKTFGYWVALNDSDLIIDGSGSHGIHQFPTYTSAAHTPVAIYVTAASIKFIFNTAFIPADSIVITFKAGQFSAHYNNTTFVLAEDLTFYSTLNTSDYSTPGTNIKFTTAPVETVKNYGIVDSSYTIHTGAAGESTFRRYVLETNIPKDSTHINQQYPHDHYRYMFENVLFNGKTLTYYNVWGRGNDKDYTDRSTPVLNPDYELDHPTSGINYNMVTYLQVAAGGGADSHYTLVVEISDQMMSDFGYSEYNFSLRDGSVWASLDEGSNPINARLNATPEDKFAVIDFIDNNMHMSEFVDNNNDTNACRSEGTGAQGYYLTAKSALHDLTSSQRSAFENGNDPEIADARARYEAWAVANNDGAPFDGNDEIVTPLSVSVPFVVEALDGKNNMIVVITIIVTALSVLMLGSYFYLRKKNK